MKTADESMERFRRLAEIHDPEADATGRSKTYLGRRSELAAGIAKAMSRHGGPTFGSKARITAGDVYADVPMLSADPFARPRPPASLVDALPVGKVTTPTFTYLRQSTRTNNAAAVAVGGAKPTSVYGLTAVDGRLHVIAHVSEPFDEYWTSDSPSLLRFLESEMVAGLYSALEAQILTGDGLGANLTGLANVSGIQTQAFATDRFLTTRKAITAVESLGYVPRMFVLNPADWEALETAAFTGGAYVLNGSQGNLPVDAATRRLWGVPVVLSAAQAAGAGFLISDGAVELVSDGQDRHDERGQRRLQPQPEPDAYRVPVRAGRHVPHGSGQPRPVGRVTKASASTSPGPGLSEIQPGAGSDGRRAARPTQSLSVAQTRPAPNTSRPPAEAVGRGPLGVPTGHGRAR